MNEPTPPDMLTVDDVAARLKLKRATVYAIMAAGLLGHYRVGTGSRGSRRCSEEQLAEYLRANKHDAVKADERPARERRSLPRDLQILK